VLLPAVVQLASIANDQRMPEDEAMIRQLRVAAGALAHADALQRAATLRRGKRRAVAIGYTANRLTASIASTSMRPPAAMSMSSPSRLMTSLSITGVALTACLDHLNRRHRAVEADRPEHADHTILLEVGHTWAARIRADIVDQPDDGRIFSATALQRLSVGPCGPSGSPASPPHPTTHREFQR
jgi:hypothetical protein